MATQILPQTLTARNEQDPAQALTTLRAELYRLHRARKAYPPNKAHYNNLIAQVKAQMAAAYAEMFVFARKRSDAGPVADVAQFASEVAG